jgi:hypothetical protein
MLMCPFWFGAGKICDPQRQPPPDSGQRGECRLRKAVSRLPFA